MIKIEKSGSKEILIQQRLKHGVGQSVSSGIEFKGNSNTTKIETDIGLY